MELTSISRRSFVAGATAVAAAMGMAGSAPATLALAEEAKKGGVLTVSLSASASKLDPIHYTGTYEGQIIGQVCDRLIEYNDALNEFIPSLATSWEISEDGISYVFQIRQGVKFHNGTYCQGREMTAEDVAWSLNRSGEFSDNSRLAMLDHAEVTGDWEVTCYLETPNAAFMTALTDAGNSVVAQEEVEGWGDDFGFHLTGTGPFVLKEFHLDEEAILETNPEYFLGASNLDGLVIRFVKDSAQAANSLITGEIDLATDITGEAINTVRNTSGIELLETQALKFGYVRFNMTHPAMSDVRVRKAMIEAVDIDAVVAALYQYGEAVRAYEPLPFGSWGYAPEHESIVPAYNPEDALALMDEAGWGQGFDVNFYVTDTASGRTLATLLQAYWATIGINVTINLSEWGTFSDTVASGNADVYCMSWSWYPDPYFFLPNLFASWQVHSNGNGAQYINPEVDELLQKAVEATDQAERATYYKEVVRIALEDMTGIYYANPNVEYGMNPRVKDFVQRADGTLRFVTAERNTWLDA